MVKEKDSWDWASDADLARWTDERSGLRGAFEQVDPELKVFTGIGVLICFVGSLLTFTLGAIFGHWAFVTCLVLLTIPALVTLVLLFGLTMDFIEQGHEGRALAKARSDRKT
jgi:hypothetical protein